MTPGGPASGGSVEATRGRTLALAALVGGAGGWLLFAIPESLGFGPPLVPTAAALVIALVALGVAGFAVTTHRTIQRRRQFIEPSRAVALLALGKTALLAGVGLAAGYAAAAVYFWPRVEAELPRERIIAAILAAVASLGLAASGFFLERACRIPRPPDDDTSATPPDNTEPD